MTREHLEMLTMLAYKKFNVPVPGVNAHPLWKELADMGYIRRDDDGKDVVSERGNTFLSELRTHATWNLVRLSVGAIRILMTLIGSDTPKEISFYGAFQLAMLGFVTVSPDDVVSPTDSGKVAANSILGYIKNL